MLSKLRAQTPPGRLLHLTLLLWVSFAAICCQSTSLESLIPEIGGTFCKYLVFKGQIHRKHMRECAEPSCTWDDWQMAMNKSHNVKKERIVLSYAHNGFGNQLWEHSVAFMIAESLNAKLLISVIPDSLAPGGATPPNTWTGYSAMERLLPSDFFYDSLPENSSVRSVCDNEPFFISDRPVDWRNRNYSSSFKHSVVDLLTDSKPRCLKMLGYFQNLPLCADDARKLWADRLVRNITEWPAENDISIYLRCVPRHYHWNSKEFYETILNHTTFERVWLFTAPECPTKLGDDASKDGPLASVFRLLYERYNATKWPQYTGSDENLALLHDLAGLVLSKKLVLPCSSWAFWAGFLSNASEVHVNAPPLHQVLPASNYIYHHEKARLYYGRFNHTSGDIDYAIDVNAREAAASQSPAQQPKRRLSRRERAALARTLLPQRPGQTDLDDYLLDIHPERLA